MSRPQTTRYQMQLITLNHLKRSATADTITI